MVVSLDGEIAYFASDNDFATHKSTGNLDIFHLPSMSGAKPRASTFLKGYVTDAITGLPLKAKVTIKELSTGKTVSPYRRIKTVISSVEFLLVKTTHV